MVEFSDDIDIYADDMEPDIFERRLFYIRLPKPIERKTSQTITCHLSVDQYDYCELMDWYYYGERNYSGLPHDLSKEERDRQWAIEREIWDWLTEWELVELRPIGPEDSEFFATDKLLKRKENDD